MMPFISYPCIQELVNFCSQMQLEKENEDVKVLLSLILLGGFHTIARKVLFDNS